MIWWILMAVFAALSLIAVGIAIYAWVLEQKYFNMSWDDDNSKQLVAKACKATQRFSFVDDFWFILLIVCFVVFTLIILICQITTFIEYNTFITEFEILREQYNTLNSLNSELLNIYNIGDLNKELAEWQAHYLRYGYWWTVVTEDVMNILPIGA